ncbi:proline-, glutamic acid- and leucine-rich protein 1-like [Colletes gigas]|uniref:proline-, glutamic acid- and leucine-rich protein 1-like n=1 Tax=Colletes gigas TaxID=935657 RepID=UPI001C9BA9B1|nr:proline-, glutamic acid- and leucine-rich protein 1-like [Colletes gigas]
MATIMELINFHDHSSKEYDKLLQDLICSNGDIPFNIEEVDEAQNVIISTINNYLNRSQTRCNGLLLLDKILSQCSKDILSKYCILWMSKATQVLESIHSVPQELSISCKILGHLIIRTKDIPEIQKQVSMQNVKQLVNAFGNLDTERIFGPVYYLIAVLLHQYPEVCERFQTSIRKTILLQIDSTQENLVHASAKCYALLAKATERSFKPPVSKPTYTNWLYHHALICNSLHTIMDELFSSLIELENINIWDKLELPNISEENIIQFYFKQQQRFLNLCSYLSCMLRGFGNKNSVLPHEILKVLCRGLAIQPSNLKNRNSIREQMLYLILPKLHIALFNVLNGLIDGFKEQLIPFGSTILQLFLQTLQWTEIVSENHITISGIKPFRNVRISVYKCLTSWLVNTNLLSGIETVANEYLPSILRDIVPERDRVLLTIQKTNNLSKRALKRLRDSQYEKGTYLNNEIGSSKENYLDVDTCKESLITLQNIFLNGGTLLKQTFFRTVQNIIIPLLYDCYLSSVDQKFYKETPECRLLLLRVLRAFQMNPHSLVPLPTQYSLEIFEMALIDSNVCISQEAKIALAELEKILHPQAPSIQISQVESIQKEFVIDSEDIERAKTLGNELDENTEDEDTAPSLNKKMKVINPVLDNSVESITNIFSMQSTEQNSEVTSHERNETVGDKLSNTEKEVTITVQDKDTVSNESRSTPDINTTLKITNSETQSTLLPNVVQENEDNQTKNMDTSEEIYHNPENDGRSPKTDQEHLPIERTEEVEEILQLFQDVPKIGN